MKLSDEAIKELEDVRFSREHDDGAFYRKCDIFISEDQAVEWMHPESFSVLDVYGKCEIVQKMLIISDGTEAVVTPVLIAKHEFEKNERTFEEIADEAVSLSKSVTSAKTSCEVI